MSTLLALDTSGALISLAIKKPGGSLVSYEVDGAGAASISLVDELAAFLDREEVNPDAVDTFIVGIGPGSFTGVRLALSVAKGWCSASGSQLVGVESLVGMAWAQSLAEGQVVVLADARRGEFFSSHFTATSRVFRRVKLTHLVRVENVDEGTSLPTVAVVERSVPADLVEGLPKEWTLVRASTIASGLIRAFEGGEFTFSAGTPSEIASVEPLYVREVAAKTIEERRNPA